MATHMKSDKWDVNPSVISALLSLHHLKQTDVARIVGVHSSQIGRRLRGEGHWTSKDVGKLADRLGVSPDTFYLSTTEFLRRLTVAQNDETPPDGGMPSSGDIEECAPWDSNPEPAD